MSKHLMARRKAAQRPFPPETGALQNRRGSSGYCHFNNSSSPPYFAQSPTDSGPSGDRRTGRPVSQPVPDTRNLVRTAAGITAAGLPTDGSNLLAAQ